MDLDRVLDVDPARLSREDRLGFLVEIEKTRAELDARAQRTLALLAREGDALARSKQWVREEVACVLSIAPVTAAVRLHDAVELVERLPHTLDRLTDASITMMHARIMTEAAGVLDDAAVAKLERRVLPRAAGTPIGVFRQIVKRAVLALDPRGAAARHRDAMRNRGVSMRAEADEMASVFAYMRADQALALLTCLDAHAGALPEDGRSMAQKRADVLADLGARALPDARTRWQGRRPAVSVSVALSTLLGLDEQAGELDGYGPISAELARVIAHDPTGTWRRLVTDSLGRLIGCGTRRYRPPAPVREHVIAEHRTCTFPGCRRDARRGELDHVIPFGRPGGVTEPHNLHPACSRHHKLKHEAGWQVTKTIDAVTWFTPSGDACESPTYAYPIDHTSDPPPF